MDAISLCGAPRYALFVAEIGGWIRNARKKYAKMSQEVMAPKLGVHRVTLANWERGAQPPPFDAVQAIFRLAPGAPLPPGFVPDGDAASILVPKTPEAREIAFHVDRLTQKQREYARDMIVRTFGPPPAPKPTAPSDAKATRMKARPTT